MVSVSRSGARDKLAEGCLETLASLADRSGAQASVLRRVTQHLRESLFVCPPTAMVDGGAPPSALREAGASPGVASARCPPPTEQRRSDVIPVGSALAETAALLREALARQSALTAQLEEARRAEAELLGGLVEANAEVNAAKALQAQRELMLESAIGAADQQRRAQGVVRREADAAMLHMGRELVGMNDSLRHATRQLAHLEAYKVDAERLRDQFRELMQQSGAGDEERKRCVTDVYRGWSRLTRRLTCSQHRNRREAPRVAPCACPCPRFPRQELAGRLVWVRFRSGRCAWRRCCGRHPWQQAGG